jgi:ribosomal protein S12 methylthiotransferase
VGVHDLLALRGRLGGEGPVTGVPEPAAANPRLVTTPARSAYLKIADGCSRRCAFCIIPRIRGRQRSRPVDDVVAEARALAASGIREAVLVAQDLTHYGTDLPDAPTLAQLVRRVADEVPGLDWIRLMYLYPRDIDDALLEVVADHPRVLKYLDIPVQHGDDRVLAAMRRGTTGRELLRLVDRIRTRVPGVVLRTTYLVGHPGETDDAFEALLRFADIARFEMAGVFPFSAEPGSHAAGLGGQVPIPVRHARAALLEDRLSGIAAAQREAQVGQVHPVLVEVPGMRGRPTEGRFWFQAPEVDGVVRWPTRGARPGDIVPVRIAGASDADYLGEAVSPNGRRVSGRGGS